MRAKDLDDRGKSAGALLAEQKTNLEAAIAKQRSLEASLEDSREFAKPPSADDFNARPDSLSIKVGSEISRLEQSIEHARELRERQENDLQQAVGGAQEIASHIAQDRTEIEQLELTLSELVPGLEQARQSQASSTDSLQTAEDALAEWQKQSDEHAQRYSDAMQRRGVEKTRAEQIESRLLSFSERRKKIQESLQGNSPAELQQKFEGLNEHELRKRQARDEFDRHLTDMSEKIRKLREQDSKLTQLVEERNGAVQYARSKFASMDALQKAALGEGDEGIQEWLSGEGLEQHSRVAQKLEVESGWERATETVLGEYLQAVCVSDITPITNTIARLKSGMVTVLREQSKDGVVLAEPRSLAEKATSAPPAVLQMLSKVVVADTLGEALGIRDRLTFDQSVVTADGVWMGKNWLRVAKDKEGKAGVIAREHDLRRLKSEMREMQVRFESARKLLRDGRSRLTQLEERREAMQKDASSLLNEYSEAKAQLESARYQLDQANARSAALAEESGELDGEQISAEEQLRESQRIYGSAEEQIGRLETERSDHETRRDELRAELQRVRSQADEDRQAVQNIAIQFESRRTSKESAAQNLERMQAQLMQFKNRETEIRTQLESSQSPLAGNKETLAELLESRMVVEEEMTGARKL